MKIRAVVGLVIVVGCVAGGWYLLGRASEDPGFPMGIAFGNPHDGTIELHLVVELGMVRTEGLKAHPAGGLETWDDWIADHFDLRDSAGTKLQLTKDGWSDVIGQDQAKNPEFFLKGKLKAGESYTLKYIPRRAGLVKHRHSFTAPATAQKFQRVFFPTE
jgi:hypothetical protein